MSDIQFIRSGETHRFFHHGEQKFYRGTYVRLHPGTKARRAKPPLLIFNVDGKEVSVTEAHCIEAHSYERHPFRAEFWCMLKDDRFAQVEEAIKEYNRVTGRNMRVVEE